MNRNFKFARWVIAAGIALAITVPGVAQHKNPSPPPHPAPMPHPQRSAPQNVPHAQNPQAYREGPHPPQNYPGPKVSAPPGYSGAPGAGVATRQVPRPPNGQQHHAGEWLRQYKDLPPDQQKKVLQSDPQFRSLPAQQQQQLQNRLQHFNSLPPQQQQRVLNRMETWEHLTQDQKGQARQLASQFKQLPPDRKQMMQTAINGLRHMPPEARERTIDSPRFQGMFSPQEREMLHGITKLPLAPAEGGIEAPKE